MEESQTNTSNAILTEQWNVPAREQQLQYAGRNVNDQQTLRQCGIGNDELLTMLRRKPAAQESVHDLATSLMSALQNVPRPQHASPNPIATLYSAISPFTKPSSDTPESWLEQAKLFVTSIRNQRLLFDTLRVQAPRVADAVTKDNYSIIISFLRSVADQLEEKRLNELARTDPNHPDVQKHIEEQIRRKAIEEQLAHAMEHNPESFASVVMLYCNVSINGHNIAALIDSGAQMTIMSKACAERCGLLRFLDTRMASVARGVGESKILGKIHSALLKIGNQFVDVSISIIEQNTLEFIFGLDMMRKHRAVIDLRRDVLVLGDESIPFLTEGEMPDRIRGSNGIKTSAEIARDTIERNMTHQIDTYSEPQATSGGTEVNASSSPTSAAAPTASSGTGNEQDPAKVKELAQMMGVSEALAIQALTVSNGDMDTAASFLLNASR